MIRRLILALLLAAFALPAAAATPACHPAPSAMHHGAPAHSEKATPAHVCVGCVPLADWLAERVTARIVPASAEPSTRVAALAVRAPPAPALPPPRLG